MYVSIKAATATLFERGRPGTNPSYRTIQVDLYPRRQGRVALCTDPHSVSARMTDVRLANDWLVK
jgi:hypothetical protein